ncbi:MAG TPA: hypothetical protein VFT62_00665 [Mycobacteriales bacterium]|nr:hypothetical protein [Mycobacteriales bacterium]
MRLRGEASRRTPRAGRSDHRLAARVVGAGALLTLAAAVTAVSVADPTPSAAAKPPSAAARPAATPAMVAVPKIGSRAGHAHPRPHRAVQRATQDAVAPSATRLSTSWGIDVSWPQCGNGGLPDLQTGFVAVGVNNGRPFTTNPCLADQVAYAKSHTGYAAYLNIDAPRVGDPTAYGRKAAVDGLARARAAGLHTAVLWLDVEVVNHWADPATNIAVISGAVRALEAHHVTAGIYSSQPMWQQITGGVDPRTPVWLATTITDYHQVGAWCASGLGGRPAVMAQYVATTGSQLIDVDMLCPAALPDAVTLFTAGRH